MCGVEDDASTMMFTDFIQLAVISKLYKKRLHTATHITQDVFTKPFVSDHKYLESTDNGIHNFVYFFFYLHILNPFRSYKCILHITILTQFSDLLKNEIKAYGTHTHIMGYICVKFEVELPDMS